MQKGLPQTAVCNLNITLPAVKKVRWRELTILCCHLHNHDHGQGSFGPNNTDEMKDGGRLWPNCRHCVFYLLKASLLHISVIFAVDSRHWLFHFVPTYLLIWMTCLLAEGFCAKGFYDYKAGFLWLDLLFACWRLFYFCVCSVFLFVFFFLICLSGFSSELELLSITPFSHPDVSFPPCFPLCYSPCFCNASWEPGNGVRCRG